MRISDWSSDVCSSDLSTRRGARCALAAATAWAALMAAPASAQSDIPLQPFPVNHELRIDSGADARFLLHGPAGEYGFIEARHGSEERRVGEKCVRRCRSRVSPEN